MKQISDFKIFNFLFLFPAQLFLFACSPTLTPASTFTSLPLYATIAPTATTVPTATSIPTEIPEPFPSSTSSPTATANPTEVAPKTQQPKTDLEIQIEQRINQVRNPFPIETSYHFDSYDFICVLENINFLEKTDSFIHVGNDIITVTGDCVYLDANEVKQTITVALVITNRVNDTVWAASWVPIPTSILSGNEQFWNGITDIEIGDQVTFGVGMPTSVTDTQSHQGHNNNIINAMFTQSQFENFAIEGNPTEVNGILIPFRMAGGN